MYVWSEWKFCCDLWCFRVCSVCRYTIFSWPDFWVPWNVLKWSIQCHWIALQLDIMAAILTCVTEMWIYAIIASPGVYSWCTLSSSVTKVSLPYCCLQGKVNVLLSIRIELKSVCLNVSSAHFQCLRGQRIRLILRHRLFLMLPVNTLDCIFEFGGLCNLCHS